MMAKVGLIDVDSHNFPNLALMKLSAYHKARGDTVEWWIGNLVHYDLVYKSRVFDDTYSKDVYDVYNADRVICGGTGYDLKNKLPDEVEHIYPDYGLYGITDTAYGYLTRGCPRGCSFCIVAEKEGRYSRKVADLSEFWHGQKNIKLLDPNLTACRERMELLRQLADSKAWVDFTQGIDARLLTEEVVEALNAVKIKMLHFAWDDMNQSEAVLRGACALCKAWKAGRAAAVPPLREPDQLPLRLQLQGRAPTGDPAGHRLVQVPSGLHQGEPHPLPGVQPVLRLLQKAAGPLGAEGVRHDHHRGAPGRGRHALRPKEGLHQHVLHGDIRWAVPAPSAVLRHRRRQGMVQGVLRYPVLRRLRGLRPDPDRMLRVRHFSIGGSGLRENPAL